MNELTEKKKENIAALPQYCGEVDTKNVIRKLPNTKQGDIFWVNADEKPYIVADKNEDKLTLTPLDETCTISTGYTVYDLNKSAVSKEQLFDWSDKEKVDELADKLQEWFHMTTAENEFYLLYGREIHYVTLIRKSGSSTLLLDCLKDFLEEFSYLISIDVYGDEAPEPKLEIWVRTEHNDAELLYMFPYDEGLAII